MRNHVLDQDSETDVSEKKNLHQSRDFLPYPYQANLWFYFFGMCILQQTYE